MGLDCRLVRDAIRIDGTRPKKKPRKEKGKRIVMKNLSSIRMYYRRMSCESNRFEFRFRMCW